MARQIKVVITGDREDLRRTLAGAGVDLEKFGKKAGGIGSKLGGLAKGAAIAGGAAGIGALTYAVKTGIEEFKHHQLVVAQTNAVIKSSGGVANVSAKGVGELSEALMKKSGVDDEVIQSGENVLLTFRNIRNEAGKGNDIFDQTTKLTLDMSVALGKDMQSSAILVGKALNDPIKGLTALQRVGVQFTQQQKDQIKSWLGVKDGAMTVAQATKEVERAQKGVETSNARLQAANEKVQSSESRLSDSRQKSKDATQKVKDAEDRVKTSLDRVQDAQEDLTASQAEATRAQERLTASYKEGYQQLQDLNDAAAGAALSQEDAQISLARAEEHLAETSKDKTATDLDKREALQAVNEAQFRLTEANKDAARATDAANEANAKGVEGTDAVTKAKADLDTATQAVADKQDALTKAQKDATAAQRAVAAAVRAQEKAQDGVAAALRAVEKAQAGATAAEGAHNAALAEAAKAQADLKTAQEGGLSASDKHAGRLKAQKLILEELNKEFGGSAEAAGKTLPGQLAILQQSFNNWAGSIVTQAQPVLQNFMGDVSRFFDEHGDEFTTWGKTIEAISTVALPVLAFVFGAMAGTAIGFISGVMQMLGGLVTVVDGVIGLVSNLIHGNWAAAWDSLGKIAGGALQVVLGVGRSIVSPLEGVFRQIYSAAKGPIDDVVGFVAGLGDRIVNVVASGGDFYKKVASAGKTAGGAFIDALKDAINAGDNFAKGVANSIIKFINAIIGMINDRLDFKFKIPVIGKEVHVNAPDIPPIKPFDMNAEGTRNYRGGWSWVGEEGPELMKVPRGADIYSNPESRAMVGGSAIHFNGPVTIGSNKAAKAMANQLAYRLKFG